jgi:hypothetical protein
VNTPAASSPLLFNWSPPRPHYRALVLFLIASALLHAFCFYIFQIVYPPTAALLPAPARLSVLSPDDPESLALLRWAEAEDPALASTTRRPPDYRAFTLPRLEHIPSYAKHEPQLRTLPQTAPDLSIPSAAAIGQMPRRDRATTLPLLSRKTSAVFSDLPAQSGSPIFPDFTFHLSRADAPANARFRVAIDRDGAIQYCFLIDSSGDPALDEQARQFLLLCRFHSPPRPAIPKEFVGGAAATDRSRESGADDLIWSIATILWGNDFAPLPSATPVP